MMRHFVNDILIRFLILIGTLGSLCAAEWYIGLQRDGRVVSALAFVAVSLLLCISLLISHLTLWMRVGLCLFVVSLFASDPFIYVFDRQLSVSAPYPYRGLYMVVGLLAFCVALGNLIYATASGTQKCKSESSAKPAPGSPEAWSQTRRHGGGCWDWSAGCTR